MQFSYKTPLQRKRVSSLRKSFNIDFHPFLQLKSLLAVILPFSRYKVMDLMPCYYSHLISLSLTHTLAFYSPLRFSHRHIFVALRSKNLLFHHSSLFRLQLFTNVHQRAPPSHPSHLHKRCHLLPFPLSSNNPKNTLHFNQQRPLIFTHICPEKLLETIDARP